MAAPGEDSEAARTVEAQAAVAIEAMVEAEIEATTAADLEAMAAAEEKAIGHTGAQGRAAADTTETAARVVAAGRASTNFLYYFLFDTKDLLL